MNYLLDKKYDETFSINFLGVEEFTFGNKLILDMPDCVDNLTDIIAYTDNVQGETDITYLKKYFKYKNDENSEWSIEMPIEEITTFEFCYKKCLKFKLIYYRIDDDGNINDDVIISLTNPSISGDFEFTTNDDPFVLDVNNPIQIFNVADVFKIFSISDFEIISVAKYEGSFNVKYRYTQDNGLSFSDWEYLNKENITTVNWDKLRFVNIQYMFELVNGFTSPIKIYDVIIHGDFQNITANSAKINFFGLKENCLNLYYPGSEIDESMSGIGNGGVDSTTPLDCKGLDSTTCTKISENSEYQMRMNWMTQGLRCYTNPDVGGTTPIEQLKAENVENGSFWNPYEFSKITEWHDFLAGTVNDVLGFTIDYHRTDPDGGGIDNVVHEYQLHNIVDMQTVKVLVPGNQFPDNQVIINQFNLDLFDTFKINILKKEFKKVFGVQFRPGQEDILYFCQTNRMYIVKHAQVHKDVMNAGIYYDIILEKYEQRANVVNRVAESKFKIESLTKNNTIDNLFGFNKDQDTKQITDKIQFKPKSMDFNRKAISPRIIYNKLPLYNGNIKIMESSYYLGNITNDEYAVKYNNVDNDFKKSDNRSFVMWVNFSNLFDVDNSISNDVINSYNIPKNDIYNLIDNTDENGNGYLIYYQNDKLWFKINDFIVEIPITFMTNIWYAVVINLNQRQRKFNAKIFRRNTAILITLFNKKSYEKIELDLDDDAVDIKYEIDTNEFVAINNEEIVSSEVSSKYIEMGSYDCDISETYEFSHDEDVRINGSEMSISNIRIFDNLINDGDEQFILNELIIKKTQNLIIVDNAEKQIKSENITNKSWR